MANTIKWSTSQTPASFFFIDSSGKAHQNSATSGWIKEKLNQGAKQLSPEEYINYRAQQDGKDLAYYQKINPNWNSLADVYGVNLGQENNYWNSFQDLDTSNWQAIDRSPVSGLLGAGYDNNSEQKQTDYMASLGITTPPPTAPSGFASEGINQTYDPKTGQTTYGQPASNQSSGLVSGQQNTPAVNTSANTNSDLVSKVESTDGNLDANASFVNAAFKAYHNRDANQQELTKYNGLKVSQVIKEVKAGSPDKGLNGLIVGGSSQVPAGFEYINGAKYNTKETQQGAYDNIQQLGNGLIGKPKTASTVNTGIIAPTVDNPQAPSSLTQQNTGLTDQTAERQKVIDKMNEIAGVIKNELSNQQSSLGLTTLKNEATSLETQIAEKQAEWDKRLGTNRDRRVDIRVIEGNEASLTRMKSIDLLPLENLLLIKQNKITDAQQMAKDNADTIYKAKQQELEALKTQLGFLDADEERIYEESKNKITFEKLMNEQGYIKITSDPAWKNLVKTLKLTEDNIKRDPNSDDIYYAPLGVDGGKTTTKTVKVGSGKTAKTYLITYDGNGNEISREDMGGGSSSTNNTPTTDKDTKAAEAKFKTDLAKQQANLAKGGSWATAWDTIKGIYPDIENEDLDAMLNKDKYYSQE